MPRSGTKPGLTEGGMRWKFEPSRMTTGVEGWKARRGLKVHWDVEGVVYDGGIGTVGIEGVASKFAREENSRSGDVEDIDGVG